jgi:hypothetical protein
MHRAREAKIEQLTIEQESCFAASIQQIGHSKGSAPGA